MKQEDILLKEIDLIQSCINRMASNSFIVKGWLITLIAVALALLPETINTRLVCIVGLLIIICFWYLDAFFLKTERLYRWKYDWVIENRIKGDDNFYFDLNPYNKDMWLKNNDGTKKKQPSILSIMFTKTLVPLYVLLVMAVIFVLVYSCFE